MSSKKTVISVIIISYNCAKTIERTINSIICQKGKFEIEIIVVDDGSDDDAVNIIQNLKIKNNLQLKILVNNRSDGVKNIFQRIDNSVHKGIMEATGQYLRLISGDDYFFDDTVFEKQLTVLEEQRDRIACAGKFYWGFCGDRLLYRKTYDMSLGMIDIDTYFKNNSYLHSSTLLIRNVFREHEDEWKNLSFDDVALVLLLLKVGQISVIDEFICVYSQRFISVSNGYEDEKELKNDIATVTWLSALKGIYGKQYNKIIRVYRPALKKIYHNRKKFLEIVDEEWRKIFRDKNCAVLVWLSGNFWERLWAKVLYALLCCRGGGKTAVLSQGADVISRSYLGIIEEGGKYAGNKICISAAW